MRNRVSVGGHTASGENQLSADGEAAKQLRRYEYIYSRGAREVCNDMANVIGALLKSPAQFEIVTEYELTDSGCIKNRRVEAKFSGKVVKMYLDDIRWTLEHMTKSQRLATARAFGIDVAKTRDTVEREILANLRLLGRALSLVADVKGDSASIKVDPRKQPVRPSQTLATRGLMRSVVRGSRSAEPQ